MPITNHPQVTPSGCIFLLAPSLSWSLCFPLICLLSICPTFANQLPKLGASCMHTARWCDVLPICSGPTVWCPLVSCWTNASASCIAPILVQMDFRFSKIPDGEVIRLGVSLMDTRARGVLWICSIGRKLLHGNWNDFSQGQSHSSSSFRGVIATKASLYLGATFCHTLGNAYAGVLLTLSFALQCMMHSCRVESTVYQSVQLQL